MKTVTKDRKMVFSLAFFALIFLFGVNAVQGSLYTLHLYITDSENQPIEGAVVFLNDEPDYEAVSDVAGEVVYHLSPGSYQLISYAANYLDYHSQVHIATSDTLYHIQHSGAIYWCTSPADAPIGVGEKNGIRMAAAGDKLYLWAAYGGVQGTSNYGGLTDFYQYDTQTDTWSQLPDAPFSSSYGISTAWGKNAQGEDAIYILKGYWSGQRTWLARYNIEQGQWEEGLAHEIPWREDLGNQYYGDNFQNYPRNGAAMAYTDEGYIYLLPGSGYGYEKYDWYRYSIEEDTWEELGTLPHRQGPGNAVIYVQKETQDYLYVQFGITPSGNYSAAEFWRYGLESQQWEKLADHAYGADDGSMLVWDGNDHIYHSPGAWEESSWDQGESQKREFMQYSISSNSWVQMEKTPYHRWGGWDDAGGMVLIGDYIYAMKGGDDVAWAEDGSVSGGGDIPNHMLWRYSLNPHKHELKVLESQGMGSINLEPGTTLHPQGATLKIIASPQEGWEFKKWLVNSNLHSESDTSYITITQDIILQAVFNEIASEIPTHKLQADIYAHQDELHVRHFKEELHLYVYDIHGRKIFSQYGIGPGGYTFRPATWQGIYIVRLWHPQQGQIVKKVFMDSQP